MREEWKIREGSIRPSPDEMIHVVQRTYRNWPVQYFARTACSADQVERCADAVLASPRSRKAKTAALRVLVSAALTNGHYSAGLKIADATIQTLKVPWFKWKKSTPGLSLETANQALRDLRDEMSAHDQRFFLISGTLLGVIREGRLLGHDKDIDVGVFDAEKRDLVRDIFRKSPYFRMDNVYHGPLIKLTHKNGTKVDIFFHFVEGDEVWHGSDIHRWRNSKWWRGGEDPLASVRYAGESFLVPSDWDTYLTENYGDWRTPVKVYDATLDCPNLSFVGRDVFQLHCRRRLIRMVLQKDLAIDKYLSSYLHHFGEDDFLLKARSLRSDRGGWAWSASSADAEE